MCGLFGWYLKPGEFTIDEKGRMAEILIKESDYRGGDSWGVACPTSGNRYEIYKDLDKLQDHKFAKAISAFDIVYGHTRKATTGKIAVRNCHPFQVNHVIGAHNGMISNYTELNKKYKRNCEVDSQHIFYHLSENKPLDELTGWGAFWWFKRSKPSELSLFKEGFYNLSVFGIGEHGKKVDGLVFISDKRDGEKALETLKRPYFEYQFYAGEEYVIASPEKLSLTNNKMRLGQLWYGASERGGSYSVRNTLPTYTHLKRSARSKSFIAISDKCAICKFDYLYLTNMEGVGNVCFDCETFIHDQRRRCATDTNTTPEPA